MVREELRNLDAEIVDTLRHSEATETAVVGTDPEVDELVSITFSLLLLKQHSFLFHCLCLSLLPSDSWLESIQ